MDYISTWGYCYCHFKWEDLIYEENKNIFDASDCFIYECVAVENDMLVIQYGEERVQIPPSSYEIVDTPRYKLGEKVYIPMKKKDGKIYNIVWNSKEQTHIYLVEIDGKKDFQRYDAYYFQSKPKYQIGEEVYIPRREENGKIIDMDWHYKNQDHMYFLEINGKKYSRRYYENELRKLNCTK